MTEWALVAACLVLVVHNIILSFKYDALQDQIRSMKDIIDGHLGVLIALSDRVRRLEEKTK